MKTISLARPGKLDCVETSEPREPGPGEALVRVHRAGVCGTDFGAYLSARQDVSPTLEVSGDVRLQRNRMDTVRRRDARFPPAPGGEHLRRPEAVTISRAVFAPHCPALRPAIPPLVGTLRPGRFTFVRGSLSREVVDAVTLRPAPWPYLLPTDRGDPHGHDGGTLRHAEPPALEQRGECVGLVVLDIPEEQVGALAARVRAERQQQGV